MISSIAMKGVIGLFGFLAGMLTWIPHSWPILVMVLVSLILAIVIDASIK